MAAAVEDPPKKLETKSAEYVGVPPDWPPPNSFPPKDDGKKMETQAAQYVGAPDQPPAAPTDGDQGYSASAAVVPAAPPPQSTDQQGYTASASSTPAAAPPAPGPDAPPPSANVPVPPPSDQAQGYTASAAAATSAPPTTDTQQQGYTASAATTPAAAPTPPEPDQPPPSANVPVPPPSDQGQDYTASAQAATQPPDEQPINQKDQVTQQDEQPISAKDQVQPVEEKPISEKDQEQPSVDLSRLSSQEILDKRNNGEITDEQSAQPLYDALMRENKTVESDPGKLADQVIDVGKGLVTGVTHIPQGLMAVGTAAGKTLSTLNDAFGSQNIYAERDHISSNTKLDPADKAQRLALLDQAIKERDNQRALGMAGLGSTPDQIQAITDSENKVRALMQEADPDWVQMRQKQAIHEALAGGELGAGDLYNFFKTVTEQTQPLNIERNVKGIFTGQSRLQQIAAEEGIDGVKRYLNTDFTPQMNNLRKGNLDPETSKFLDDTARFLGYHGPGEEEQYAGMKAKGYANDPNAVDQIASTTFLAATAGLPIEDVVGPFVGPVLNMASGTAKAGAKVAEWYAAKSWNLIKNYGVMETLMESPRLLQPGGLQEMAAEKALELGSFGASKLTSMGAQYAADFLAAAAKNEYEGANAVTQFLGRTSRMTLEAGANALPYAIGTSQSPEQFGEAMGQMAPLHMALKTPGTIAESVKGANDALFITDPKKGNSPVPDTTYGRYPGLDAHSAQQAAKLDQSQLGTYTRVKRMMQGKAEIYLVDDAGMQAAQQRYSQAGGNAMNSPRGFVADPSVTGHPLPEAYVNVKDFNEAFLHEAVGHPAYNLLNATQKADLARLVRQTNDPVAFTKRYFDNSSLQGTDYNSLPTQAEVTAGTRQPGPGGYTQDKMNEEMAAEQLGAMFSGGTIDQWSKNPTLQRKMKMYVGAAMERLGIPSTTLESTTKGLGVQPSITSTLVFDKTMRDKIGKRTQGYQTPGQQQAGNPANMFNQPGQTGTGGTTPPPAAGGGAPPPPPPTGGPATGGGTATGTTGPGPIPTNGAAPPTTGPNVATQVTKAVSQPLVTQVGGTTPVVKPPPTVSPPEAPQQQQQTEAKPSAPAETKPAEPVPQTTTVEPMVPPAEFHKNLRARIKQGQRPGEAQRAVEKGEPAPEVKGTQPTGQEPALDTPSVQSFVKGRNGNQPDYIILHSSDGNEQSGLNQLTHGPVSAHYFTTKDGRVHHLVSEDDTAWHGGQVIDPKYSNEHTIGIEQEHIDGQPWSDAQVQATARTVADIMRRRNIPLDHVIGHHDIAPERKVDPLNFPWDQFRQYVTADLNGELPKGRAPLEGVDKEEVGALEKAGLNVTHFGYKSDPYGDPESLAGHGKYNEHMIPRVSVALNDAAVEKLKEAGVDVEPGKPFTYEGREYRYDDKVPELYTDARFDIFDPDEGLGVEGRHGGTGPAASFMPAASEGGTGAAGTGAQLSPLGALAPSLAGGPPAAPGAVQLQPEVARAPVSAPSAAEVDEGPENIPLSPAASYAYGGGGMGAPAAPGAGVSFMPSRRKRPADEEEEEEGGFAPVKASIGQGTIAGLNRAVQQHVGALPPGDTRVQKNPDDGLFKGTHFVQGDPLHDTVQANIPQNEKNVLNLAQKNIATGTPFHFSYASAPKAGLAQEAPTTKSRQIEYEMSSPQARMLKTGQAQIAGHTILPLNVGAKLADKKGDPHQGLFQGISTNTLANNHYHLNSEMAAAGLRTPYPTINDKFLNDLEGYTDNLSAGWRGTGDKLQVGTAEHPVTPEAGYTPYKLKPHEANFINAVINNQRAMSKKSVSHRALAEAGGTLIDPEGETNPLRYALDKRQKPIRDKMAAENPDNPDIQKSARKRWSEDVLEPTIRTFKAGLVHEVHHTHESIPEGIRPGDEFKEVTDSLRRAPMKKIDVPASVSFMPSQRERNQKLNDIEREYTESKDKGKAAKKLEAMGEEPEDYRFVEGHGMITPHEDAEKLTPEEHEELTGNLRKQWISGKLKTSEYRERLAEIPLPEKPSVSFMPMAGPRATGFQQAQREKRTFTSPLDQREKFEINDQDMEMRRMPKTGVTKIKQAWGNAVKLADAIKHPELFENYPQLRNTKIRHDPTIDADAYYEHPYTDEGKQYGDEVVLKDDEDKQALAHELQHAVQYHEGFAKGTSPDHIMQQLQRSPEVLDEVRKQAEAALPDASATNQNRWITGRLRKMAFAKYQNEPGEVEARAAGQRAVTSGWRVPPEESLQYLKQEAAERYPEGAPGEPPAAPSGVSFMPAKKAAAAPAKEEKLTKPKGVDDPKWMADPKNEAERQAYLEKRVANTLAGQNTHPSAIPMKVQRTDTGAVQHDPDLNPVWEKTDYNIANLPFLQDKGKALGQIKGADKHEDTLDEDEHKNLIPVQRARLSALREASAVATLGDHIVESYNKIKDQPDIAAGKGWYSRMREKMAKVFGAGEGGKASADHELFAQLLGATSAKTPVRDNFIQALDAFEQHKAGKFAKHIEKYKEAYKAMQDGGYEALNQKMREQGILKEGDEVPDTDAKAMARWIKYHDIIPKKQNGAKFNSNSEQVLKVLAGTWLNEVGAPKTPNFAGNLTGRTLAATIDVWAARHLHRIGNEHDGEKKGWRPQAAAEPGVNDLDFAYSQDAFKHAADKIGINPDDLQAILWYAEKHHYDTHGMTGAQGAEKGSFDETWDKAFPTEGKAMTSKDLQEHYQLEKKKADRIESVQDTLREKRAGGESQDKIEKYLKRFVDPFLKEHGLDRSHIEPPAAPGMEEAA